MLVKKILWIVLSLFFTLNFLEAKSSDIAVEIARTKKIDAAIQRVNSVNKYINLYIKETGNKDISKNTLQNYFDMDNNLFKSYNQLDDFNITLQGDTKVKYSNVLTGNISEKLKKYYLTSPAHHPMADINSSDYSITIVLDPDTISILNTNLTLSKTEPEDKSKPWYKPDSKGGYETYLYVDGKWQLQSKKENNKIYKKVNIINSVSELNSTKGEKGDIAFVKNGDNTTIKYINVDGATTWMIVGSSYQISTNSCTKENAGVLRYSKEDDCIQRCIVDDKNSKWKCLKTKTLPATIKKDSHYYKSCEAVFEINPDSKDGIYTIDPDGEGGEKPYKTYCEKTKKIVATNSAFAALKDDGSIICWGNGGKGAPTDKGYIKIVALHAPLNSAFAALKNDGSITAWGDAYAGRSGAPTDKGYINIFSAENAFAALKKDGSIYSWGNGYNRLYNTPTDKEYIQILSSGFAFAALKEDGSISTWFGGGKAPTDKGYVKIFSNYYAFAALKKDGSISAWGSSAFGGSGAPTDKGYVTIVPTKGTFSSAFAALKKDGSITAWGYNDWGGSGAPTDKGYVKIFSTGTAFAALKKDGSITAWGYKSTGGSGAPTDKGYVKIFSNTSSFVALKQDGSITTWGVIHNSPSDKGYVQVASTSGAFAALKKDGSITVWGNPAWGGSGAPTDKGYIKIYSNRNMFVAMKADGTISTWGNNYYVGKDAPSSIK